MRPEQLYLQDIVDACDRVQEFLKGISESEFHKSELHRSAILQQLTVVGEAVSRLSTEFRDAHPEVEWRDIVGFRNIAVHAYFSIQWHIVWATANDDVPKLRKDVSSILTKYLPKEEEES